MAREGHIGRHAITEARTGRLVLLVCATFATILALSIYQESRAGTSCETTWSSAADGSWLNPAMWSNGVPSSSGTANDDACITVAGTYTVF